MSEKQVKCFIKLQCVLLYLKAFEIFVDFFLTHQFFNLVFLHYKSKPSTNIRSF